MKTLTIVDQDAIRRAIAKLPPDQKPFFEQGYGRYDANLNLFVIESATDPSKFIHVNRPLGPMLQRPDTKPPMVIPWFIAAAVCWALAAIGAGYPW